MSKMFVALVASLLLVNVGQAAEITVSLDQIQKIETAVLNGEVVKVFTTYDGQSALLLDTADGFALGFELPCVGGANLDVSWEGVSLDASVAGVLSGSVSVGRNASAGFAAFEGTELETGASASVGLDGVSAEAAAPLGFGASVNGSLDGASAEVRGPLGAGASASVDTSSLEALGARASAAALGFSADASAGLGGAEASVGAPCNTGASAAVDPLGLSASAGARAAGSSASASVSAEGAAVSGELGLSCE